MIFKTSRLRAFAVELGFTFIVSALVFAQTPVSTPLTIDQTNVPIRVDGHLNDWPSVRMILLNLPSQVTYGKAYWKGEADFSGRVFLTYDEQLLYVAAGSQKN